MPLDSALRLRMYDRMLRSREVELRLISMVKSGDGHFWIGGPGEEAFNVALGCRVKAGEGPAFDYLLLHYRNTGVLMALDVPILEPVRLMRSTATDPFSRGRTFSGHYAYKPLNILPVTSPIETQFSVAPGLALAQKRMGSDGITIVVGGDAGAAEADFATGMIWSSMPGREVPVLFIVTDNRVGISTPKSTIWPMENVSDRARPFGMPVAVVDGNDPDASYEALGTAMDYVRREKKPYMLEAKVSRMYGHSSSSGGNRDESHDDPLARYEAKLISDGILTADESKSLRKRYADEALAALERVRKEPLPDATSIYDHVFLPSEVDRVWARGFHPLGGR